MEVPVEPDADEQKSALSLVLEELREPGGIALAFASIGLTLVAIFFSPEQELPLQWLLALGVLASAYITLTHTVIRKQTKRHHEIIVTLNEAIEENRIGLPKVLRAIKNPQVDDETILLLEGNRLFGQSMLVSIYFEDEDRYEMLVGGGRVQSSQMNGLLQIAVDTWMEAHSDVRDGVRAGRQDYIGRLLVRPAPTTQSDMSGKLSPDTIRLVRWLVESTTTEPAPDEPE